MRPNRHSALFIASFLLGSIPSVYGSGLIVAAGGGPEGDIGETTAWSYKLYKRLVENGDVTGDKKVKVVVISSEKPDTNFIVDYFKSMGADSSENLVITSREDANNPKLVNTLKDADVVFFRGGNQAIAYRNWKGTQLQGLIKQVQERGGALGGTSSGAMSLAGYALAGGQDVTSVDVLQNSHSALLNDESGKGSSIHPDFLNLVPNTIIDTHVGGRARLGRMLGVHAKAVEDSGNRSILMIGLEEKTGVAIQDGKAQVYGTGTVQFIQQTPETQMVRKPGHPLVYTNLRNDILTDGWTYDLNARQPDTQNAPPSAQPVQYSGDCGMISGKPQIRGNHTADRSKFEQYINYWIKPYSVMMGKARARFGRTIGFLDAQSSKDLKDGNSIKSDAQASAFQALYEHPNSSVLLVPAEGMITPKSESDDEIVFSRNPAKRGGEMATLVLDCKQCTYKSVSPFLSNMDIGKENMKSVGVVNARVHSLAESAQNGLSYNIRTHEVQGSASSGPLKDCDLSAANVRPMDPQQITELQKHLSCD